MGDLMGIAGGVLMGICTLLVIVIGVMYDRAEYEARQEEKRNAKKKEQRNAAGTDTETDGLH